MKPIGVRTSCLLVVSAIIYLLPSYIAAQERIVGGTATKVRRYPFMVILKVSGSLACGGSLVTKRFVVTAAHCVINTKPRQITVVGGTSNVLKGGKKRSVSKIIRPKAYNARTDHMDVAVLKLRTALTGSNIGTISLCRTSMVAGRTLTVVGWGRLSESGGYPVQLRKVQVPVISRAKCKRQYGSSTITNSMICAQRSGKDACSGDSGGPAINRGRLCGIVSWGNGCARRNYAGVYTSVPYSRKFIRKALKV